MLMRWRMRRRSVSSFVSPGPRVPMPPPSRDSAVLDPTSRGSRYFSCASSTCSLPSRVRARRAKMSRISCVRSRTLRSSAFSRLRSCAGRQLVVEDDDVDVELVAATGRASSTLPLPRKVAGSGLGRSCSTRSTTSAPAADARPASSSRECSGSNWRDGPLKRPTSAARSRPLDVVERRAASSEGFGEPRPARVSAAGAARITAAILARAPTAPRRRESAVVRAAVTSTMVDGGPPGDGPPSSTSVDRCSPRSIATCVRRRCGHLHRTDWRWSR